MSESLRGPLVPPRRGVHWHSTVWLYLRCQPAELRRIGRAQLLTRAAARRGLAELTLAHRRGALTLRGGRTCEGVARGWRRAVRREARVTWARAWARVWARVWARAWARAWARRGGRACAAEVLLRRHQHVEGLGGLAGRRGGACVRRAVRRAVVGRPRVRWACGGGGGGGALLRGAGEARHFGSGDGRGHPVGES